MSPWHPSTSTLRGRGAACNDNNRGTLNTVDMLDAGATSSLLDERMSIGLFGNNLTNRVVEGNESPFAGAVYSEVIGSTDPLVFGSYRPFIKGRVYGTEVNYRL